jgi:hypothetical protein
MNIIINDIKSEKILEIYTKQRIIKDDNRDNINFIKDKLKDILNEYELIWCGSTCKNTDINTSDLDLLVVKKHDIYRGEVVKYINKNKIIYTDDKPNKLCQDILDSFINIENIKIENKNEYILLKYNNINIEILPTKKFINSDNIFIIPKTVNNWKIGFSRNDKSKIDNMNGKINDGYFKKIIKIFKTIKDNNKKFPSFFIEYMIYHYFKKKLETNTNTNNIELYDVCNEIINFINDAINNNENYYHLSNYNINILDHINKRRKDINIYKQWIISI